MAYICLCTDRPGAAEERARATPQHLEDIESIIEHILVAGPLIDEGSGEYNASCFVYAAENEQQALELLRNDPYFRAGIYAEVQCRRFRPAAGTWIGGKTW